TEKTKLTPNLTENTKQNIQKDPIAKAQRGNGKVIGGIAPERLAEKKHKKHKTYNNQKKKTNKKKTETKIKHTTIKQNT
ncbi:hypothetical protein, partial [Acinetobacter baumannii]